MASSCSRLLLLAICAPALGAELLAQPATDGQPKARPDLYAPTITAQHPNGARYVIVPNNMRTRMFGNHVQEAADAFAATRTLVAVQIGNEQLRIPQEAISNSPPSPGSATPAVKKWDEATKSYLPFAGGVDSRYVPSYVGRERADGDALGIALMVERSRDFREAMSAQYSVYGFPHPITSLAHAGQGVLNEPGNDVWVRDPKGTSFFVDGNEWVEVLKMMASDGQGKVSSLKPDIWELTKLNDASRQAGIFKSIGVALVCLLVLVPLLWYLRKKPV